MFITVVGLSKVLNALGLTFWILCVFLIIPELKTWLLDRLIDYYG